LAGLMFAGCWDGPHSDKSEGQEQPGPVSGNLLPKPVSGPSTAGPVQADLSETIAGDPGSPGESTPFSLPPATLQEKYDAALLQALDRMAERKYAQALASLEVAQTFQ